MQERRDRNKIKWFISARAERDNLAGRMAVATIIQKIKSRNIGYRNGL